MNELSMTASGAGTRTAQPSPPRANGYFDNDSMIRRLHRERALALSGPRALLMQAAHPLAFAGLLAHSGALDDPYVRLARTAEVMNVITFGARRDADRLTRRVRAMHGSVSGKLPETVGRLPAGAAERAGDAEISARSVQGSRRQWGAFRPGRRIGRTTLSCCCGSSTRWSTPPRSCTEPTWDDCGPTTVKHCGRTTVWSVACSGYGERTCRAARRTCATTAARCWPVMCCEWETGHVAGRVRSCSSRRCPTASGPCWRPSTSSRSPCCPTASANSMDSSHCPRQPCARRWSAPGRCTCAADCYRCCRGGFAKCRRPGAQRDRALVGDADHGVISAIPRLATWASLNL